MESSRTYLPAAGRDWLLPLYDPFVKMLGGDAARRLLLDQSAIRPGHRVLDIGCGTGTLAAMIKKLHPSVEVVGLDPDPKALVRARNKTERSGLVVRFDQGFADQLHYPDASFDRAFSSFMFHHLPAEVKEKMLDGVRRVLKPDGEFHMLDFEGPNDGGHGFLRHLFHSNHRLEDNSESRVISLMTQSGLANVKKVGSRSMLFGNIAYYRATT